MYSKPDYTHWFANAFSTLQENTLSPLIALTHLTTSQNITLSQHATTHLWSKAPNQTTKHHAITTRHNTPKTPTRMQQTSVVDAPGEGSGRSGGGKERAK